MHRICWIVGLALGLAGCGGTNLCKDVEGECVQVKGSGDVTEDFQTALIDAQPNSTIVIGEGTFDMGGELSLLGVDGVTIRGQGPDATVLSFAGATGGGGGAAGIKAEDVEGFTVENLAIEDTSGDGLFITDSENVVVRDVRVEWTNGPSTDNGLYGIYPVKCDGVLIERSVSRGASDAGIYVGESQRIVVRDNEAYENVAGIQIENSLDSHVHDNHAYDNTAGLMVFDLAGKERQKNGGRHRVHDNLVENNNHDNFGAAGAFVSVLPAGSGAFVMAPDGVEFFNNTIRNHGSFNFAVVSYFISGMDPSDDPEYVPYSRHVWVHDNEFEGGGDDVDVSELPGQALAVLAGMPVADMVYDGIEPMTAVEDSPNPETNPQFLCYRNNTDEDGEAEFIDLDAGAIDLDDPAGTLGDAMPSEDISPYDCEGMSQPEVTLDFAG